MSSSSSCGTPVWRVSVGVSVRADPAIGSAGRVAAMFGLCEPVQQRLYDDFEVSASPGQVVAIVGPSGAGKSVLLREIAAGVPGAQSVGSLRPRLKRTPAVQCLTGGTDRQRLALLSRCGLADATALITPAGQLSGGQQFRLLLARALHAALRQRRPTLVLADEFCSSLDRTTATVLCRRVRTLVSGSPLGLIVATPRPELLPALRPDAVIVKPPGAPARRECPRFDGRTGLPDPRRWPIRRASIADYRALGSYHYLTGPPAAHKRVYAIRTPARYRADGAPAIAGVLVVSPPLLKCRGRNVASAGRYVGADRRAAMARLNAEVECISRVIVHPMFRGCGLAVRLVRHALRTARTPAVEALAAMGKIHPFFRRAGMTPVGLFRGRSQYYQYYWAVGSRE